MPATPIAARPINGPADAFGLVFKLLEVVVPQRAAHLQPRDHEWGATLSGLRALGVAMDRDGDLLERRAEFSAVAQKAEDLESEVDKLRKQITEAAATASSSTSAASCTILADLVANRDRCRGRLLEALRGACSLSPDLAKWVNSKRACASQWSSRLADFADFADLAECAAGGESLCTGIGVDVTAAQQAMRTFRLGATAWEQRHDLKKWAGESERCRVALLEAVEGAGGLDALTTDPVRLRTLAPELNALCAALESEKGCLERDEPLSDIPRDEACAAVASVRAYVCNVGDSLDALVARFASLESRLSFHSASEAKPDPSESIKVLLDNLHGSERKRCKVEYELVEVGLDLKHNPEEGAGEMLIERKSELELELGKLSTSISKLDRRITAVRAQLLRRAEEHYPELLSESLWQKQIGMKSLFADTLLLARSGVWLEDTRFADFDVQRKLHISGGKTVFVVRDHAGKDMVLKRFSLADSKLQRHFTRQVNLLHGLKHSNVVAVLGVFLEQGHGCLLTPWYSGGDLGAWLGAHPPSARSAEQCKQIASSVIHGLCDLHANGIVHCDIKPANVFLTRSGQAVIGDFDGVRRIDATMTRVGDMQATLAYLAPEFCSGQATEVTKAMDLYALGILLGRLFEGVLSEGLQLLLKQLTAEDPTLRPGIAEVSACPFFDAKLAEIRDCGSCGERWRVEDGLACAEGHFLCNGCLNSGLRAYLQSDSERDPRVRSDHSIGCIVDPACGARLASRDVSSVVGDDTWEGVLQLENDRLTANVQQKMERKFQKRLEVELARSVEDQTVRLHFNHILDKLLSLSCPRCERVFDDFDGCFAQVLWSRRLRLRFLRLVPRGLRGRLPCTRSSLPI